MTEHLHKIRSLHQNWIQNYAATLLDDVKTGRFIGVERKLNTLLENHVFTKIELSLGKQSFKVSKLDKNKEFYNSVEKLLNIRREIDIELKDVNQTIWGSIKATISSNHLYESFILDLFNHLKIITGFALIIISLTLNLAGKIIEPIKKLTKKVRQDLSKEITKNEFKLLDIAIDHYILEIQTKEKSLAEELKEKSILKAMKQLAHDIRSPLSALDIAVEDLSKFPEEKRIIIRSAIHRIKDIANELLTKRKNNEIATSDIGEHHIMTLIDTLITEKRMQYRRKKNISIDFNYNKDAYAIFGYLNSSSFKRVISNLIDNSIEAIESEGSVNISLEKYSLSKMQIKIKDTGKGISSDILPQLMNKGVTIGKEGGSGLGLYYAKEIIESSQGQIHIQSVLEKGTDVSIILPTQQIPTWFAESIRITPELEIIILDDDPSIHYLWDERFSSFTSKKINHFYSSEDILKYQTKLSPNSFYLFDYELAGDEKNGLDIIIEMNLQSKSILVTSHYEEKEIREKCKELGVKLLPKNLAGFLPIILEDNYDLIQIDDDDLIRLLWQQQAKLKNKKILSLSHPNDLSKYSIKKRVPIYIDSCLKEDLKGEDFAKTLYLSGYEKIYLSTGREASEFKNMDFLTGIIGKDFPILF